MEEIGNWFYNHLEKVDYNWRWKNIDYLISDQGLIKKLDIVKQIT